MPTNKGWLPRLRADTPVVIALPFAGCGPSIFSQLANKVSSDWGIDFCAVRPPGIEARFAEERSTSHLDYALELSTELSTVVAGNYTLFGHCGAVPYAIETLRAIESNHGRDYLPKNVVLSGWGPPHKGLYGELNSANLDSISYRDEVRGMARATGVDLIEDFVEIYAEQLEFDIRQQRSYVFESLHTDDVNFVVVGWSDDKIVNCDISVSRDWQSSFPDANIEYHTLRGGHFEFIEGPQELCQILTSGLA